MLDILTYLPAKRKQSNSGWISFNAPCCVHNGESADRRKRGGIKSTDQGWSYHCFNCGYTSSFILGRNLSFKARKLLSWLNVPQEEIERINLESLRHRSIQGVIEERQQIYSALQNINFEERELPPGFVIVDHNTPTHYQYLRDRSIPLDYPMGVNAGEPTEKWSPRPGIIIPFTYQNRVVGHTTRFFDDKTPKYIHDIQPGYVFGTDLQQESWQYVIVTEGVFDALSISGLALLHAEINDAQARLIRGLGKEVIVVPDQDEAGIKLIDRALELGWSVSVPDWQDCKDVNDAVIRYGKLATLVSIMQARDTSKIKIELRKKWLLKKLKKS
jgi:hypothetical protein